MNMNQRIERAIVTALVEECAKAGFVPRAVWDGEEYVLTLDLDRVLSAVFSVDESTIHFAPKDAPDDWGTLGVLCIGGNGEDVISDWHCGNAAFNAAVEATCRRIEDRPVVLG